MNNGQQQRNIGRQVERDGESWARGAGRPGGREVERTFPRGTRQRQEPAPSGGYLERDRDE